VSEEPSRPNGTGTPAADPGRVGRRQTTGTPVGDPTGPAGTTGTTGPAAPGTRDLRADRRPTRRGRTRPLSLLDWAERLLTVDAVQFGLRLHEAREEAGYSIDELIVLSGVSKGEIGNLERGEVGEVGPTYVLALSWALGYLHPGALIAAHDPHLGRLPAPWRTPLRAFAAFWRWKGLPNIPSEEEVAAMEMGHHRGVVGYGGPGVQLGAGPGQGPGQGPGTGTGGAR
jgi:hypothetical protein